MLVFFPWPTPVSLAVMIASIDNQKSGDGVGTINADLVWEVGQIFAKWEQSQLSRVLGLEFRLEFKSTVFQWGFV